MVLLIMIIASETLCLHLCVHKYFSKDLWHFALNFFIHSESKITSNKPMKQRVLKLPFLIQYMH